MKVLKVKGRRPQGASVLHVSEGEKLTVTGLVGETVYTVADRVLPDMGLLFTREAIVVVSGLNRKGLSAEVLHFARPANRGRLRFARVSHNHAYEEAARRNQLPLIEVPGGLKYVVLYQGECLVGYGANGHLGWIIRKKELSRMYEGFCPPVTLGRFWVHLVRGADPRIFPEFPAEVENGRLVLVEFLPGTYVVVSICDQGRGSLQNTVKVSQGGPPLVRGKPLPQILRWRLAC